MKNFRKIQTSFFYVFTLGAIPASAQQSKNPLVVAIEAAALAGNNEAARTKAEKTIFDLLKTDRGKRLVNSTEEELAGTLPIHAAVKAGNTKVLEALLIAGAQADRIGRGGIVDARKPIDRSGNGGQTPIGAAVVNENYEVARFLLSRNPSLFEVSDNGQNVLHILAEKIAKENLTFESDPAKLFLEIVRKGAPLGDHYLKQKLDSNGMEIRDENGETLDEAVLPLNLLPHRTIASDARNDNGEKPMSFADFEKAANKAHQEYLDSIENKPNPQSTDKRIEPSAKKH